MLRLFQHLLPRALAWSTTAPTRLRAYLEGLAGLPRDVRTFVDLVYLDALPATTRELARWEKQFGLSPGGGETDRRSKLAGAWSVQGSQSPDYLQRALHAAGFTTVFVYEWWAYYGSDSMGPDPDALHYVARNPNLYTTHPLIGIYQCEWTTPWQCFDSGPGDPLAAHCDDTLANDPGYIVNLDLTRRSPPPVPSDPSRWPYFLYIAGAVFPDRALVPRSRLAELKELILRIAPAQQWIVFMVDGVDDFGGGFGAGEFGSAPFGA